MLLCSHGRRTGFSSSGNRDAFGSLVLQCNSCPFRLVPLSPGLPLSPFCAWFMGNRLSQWARGLVTHVVFVCALEVVRLRCRQLTITTCKWVWTGSREIERRAACWRPENRSVLAELILSVALRGQNCATRHSPFRGALVSHPGQWGESLVTNLCVCPRPLLYGSGEWWLGHHVDEQ